MSGGPVACTAFDETVVFLSHFKDLTDPRQQGKVCYPLEEILLLCLLLCLLAVLAGAETMTEIAMFGDKKLELLRRFRSDEIANTALSDDPSRWQRDTGLLPQILPMAEPTLGGSDRD